MNTSFKIGDVVRIKSTGAGVPNMTVGNIQETEGIIYITCIWWNNALSKFDEKSFIEQTLIKA